MSYTTYSHLPPEGTYRARNDDLVGYLFYSRGTGDYITYTAPGQQYPPGMYNDLGLDWVRMNGLERIGDLP